MIFKKEWAMPNMHTFTIQPIKELVYKYVGTGKGWIDPTLNEANSAIESDKRHREHKYEQKIVKRDIVNPTNP